ncbi:MAG: diacylglycerol kinase family protein [Ornithinimicrobium sp.]|uniref:diacylglycerol/lipid kinase family protein n=1 Tax=Ornithinimicrobium sp. TaxID=1977084 RepID=UPI0026DF261B|nr:diacylglycerol kinase family protein [Ornithinimicrobium sp.]MDO5738570.1 diacylglycerol kinase family protein [Ornithinimicrobium sp.]
MRYAVAHGRRSGRGRAAELGQEAVRRLRAAGHDVVEVTADSLDHARSACGQLVAEGLDVLVVAGGDGGVSLATDLCAGTSTAVAILPSGTGNDNARSLRIPLGPEGALETLLADHRRTVDTLYLPDLDRHVLGSVPAALDARISVRASGSARHLGSFSYTMAALIEIALLRRQPPLHYTLTVDGCTEELDALVVAPVNMPVFGGGLRIAPQADPSDGWLDLVVIRPVTPLQALGLLRQVRAARHTSHSAVRITPAHEVRIAGPADIVAQADGEEVGPLPLTVRLSPADLQMIAPPLT